MCYIVLLNKDILHLGVDTYFFIYLQVSCNCIGECSDVKSVPLVRKVYSIWEKHVWIFVCNGVVVCYGVSVYCCNVCSDLGIDPLSDLFHFFGCMVFLQFSLGSIDEKMIVVCGHVV